MSTDLQIRWDLDLLEGDFLFENNDLVSEEGLYTAVLISLFSDRRAAEDDILPDINNPDRKGWWGDLTVAELPNDQIGSLLWLLVRSKTTPQVLLQAKNFIEESLQWMLDDGIVVKLNVEVERQNTPGEDRLAFKVQLFKTDGNLVSFSFDPEWENTINAI